MVTRVFVEKKQGFNIEAQQMLADLKGNLGLRGLEEVRKNRDLTSRPSRCWRT